MANKRILQAIAEQEELLASQSAEIEKILAAICDDVDDLILVDELCDADCDCWLCDDSRWIVLDDL